MMKQGRRQRRSENDARSRRAWKNMRHGSRRRNDRRSSVNRKKKNRENCGSTNFTLSRLHLCLRRCVAA
jgi:hypothetical protein